MLSSVKSSPLHANIFKKTGVAGGPDPVEGLGERGPLISNARLKKLLGWKQKHFYPF